MKTRPFLLVATLFLTFGSVPAQKAVRPSSGLTGAGFKYFGAPLKTTVSGYFEAHAVTVEPGFRIIKGRTGNAETFGDGDFLFERNGKVEGKWSGAASIYANTEGFEVLKGDLDGNGTPELIVTELESVSNGMGVRMNGVYIFPDEARGGFRRPMYFSAYEYGRNGTFVRDGGENLILACDWRDLTIDAKRGSGLYLIGRFFRYRNGELMPALDKPILARRFLNSFADERAKTEESPAVPLLWLSGGKAQTFKTEPGGFGKVVSERPGTIQKVEVLPIKSEEATSTDTMVTIRFDDGKEENLRMESLFNENQIQVVGFDGKFLVPDGISLRTILGENVNRKVRLVKYADGFPEIVLWIQSGK